MNIPINTLRFTLLVLLVSLNWLQTFAQDPTYSWKNGHIGSLSVEQRVPTPGPYERIVVPPLSFGEWLRNLPTKSGNPPVHLFDGRMKPNQGAHHLVLDIDVGKRDLQQCADAVMRLKAEYHFSINDHENIHFNFTSGDNAKYSKWKQGYRPIIKGNTVSWVKRSDPDRSYASFRKYMNIVFSYAGTYSLEKELIPITDIHDMCPGDVFIQGGFPGHAVIVIDVAEDPNTRKKIFLLAQSYMPAQEIHILKNPNSEEPWYEIPNGTLYTPEWSFPPGSLKRFAQ